MAKLRERIETSRFLRNVAEARLRYSGIPHALGPADEPAKPIREPAPEHEQPAPPTHGDQPSPPPRDHEPTPEPERQEQLAADREED